MLKLFQSSVPCVLFLLLSNSLNSSAFIPASPSDAGKGLYVRSILPENIQEPRVRQHFKARPLFYREHNDGDEDATMLKLAIRAGPTFKKEEIKPKSETSREGINSPLLFALVTNQVFVLGTAIIMTSIYLVVSGDAQFPHEGILNWSGLKSSPSAAMDLSLTPMRFLQGVLGSLFPLMVGSSIEKSDDRRFANANFSTIFMVMTLFGRRSKVSSITIEDSESSDTAVKASIKMDRLEPSTRWTDVALISLGLSYLTGFCEEITFRGLIPHLLKSTIFLGSVPLACVGQAAIFGLGHFAPTTSQSENKLIATFQFFNGLWFGLLFLLTGGDLVPCIIAHTIYDFSTFFFTWMKANEQIEYAYYMTLEQLSPEIEKELNAIKSKFTIKVPQDEIEMCKRLFYILDTNKNGAVSKPEVQKGINYLDVEKVFKAPPRETVNSIFDSCIKNRNSKEVVYGINVENELQFLDFMQLFYTLKSNAVLA
jgi:membrane protease YdiL (CAAX protease family)